MPLSHCSKTGLKHWERQRDDEIIGKDCRKKRMKTVCKRNKSFLEQNVFFVCLFFKSIEKETTGRDAIKRASTHFCSCIFMSVENAGHFTITLLLVRHTNIHTHCSCKPPTHFVTHTIKTESAPAPSITCVRARRGWTHDTSHTEDKCWTLQNMVMASTCSKLYICMCSRTSTCQSQRYCHRTPQGGL